MNGFLILRGRRDCLLWFFLLIKLIKNIKAGEMMIAVFVNSEGITSTLTEQGIVILYEKDQEGWKNKRQLPFCLEKHNGISQIRTSILSMVDQLGDCKVFVAKEISGQLYYILEANGFDSFEAEGKPELYLDSIWEELQSKNTKEDLTEKEVRMETKPALYPLQLDQEGVYYINLKQALSSDCTLTSKKIIKPFLHKQEITCLNILCDHIPPWFQNDLKTLGYDYIILMLKEKLYQVSIHRKEKCNTSLL